MVALDQRNHGFLLIETSYAALYFRWEGFFLSSVPALDAIEKQKITSGHSWLD
jgi:hypothetical protein